ncbi:rhodanese-like domain-containing protein [Oceanobacillus oncorhynchi subsp. oncorhynchi]|uniref:rhodanese-like domain-containing protein n=1 Tax=Oceanobacillus oncorhynchi TaxID=545501 RepID=UPI0031D8729F
MKSIQVNELAKKIRQCQHINIIDVREEIEVAAGKIPEAKHIPLGELADSLEKLDKNEHYYLICHSGGRTGQSSCRSYVWHSKQESRGYWLYLYSSF